MMEINILDVDTKAGVAYISGLLPDGTPIGSLFGDAEYNGKTYKGQYVKRMEVDCTSDESVQASIDKWGKARLAAFEQEPVTSTANDADIAKLIGKIQTVEPAQEV